MPGPWVAMAVTNCLLPLRQMGARLVVGFAGQELLPFLLAEVAVCQTAGQPHELRHVQAERHVAHRTVMSEGGQLPPREAHRGTKVGRSPGP